MGASFQSDEQGPVAEINITPFVDVMLVLLVIFMVTAPLMESGIAVNLPKASAKALPKNEKPLTLTLTKDSRMYLNREEIGLIELRNRLEKLSASHSEPEIFIRADGTLPYSIVALAMATVKNAGVSKIGLVTLPPEGSSPK